MSEYRPPSPFSPKPDYKSMELDQIKKHAMQYGLSVGQTKGRLVKILDEIYHATHQYETDSDFEWEVAAKGTDALKEPSHRKNPPHTPPTPAMIPEAKKVKKRPPIHQMSSSDEADEPIVTPPTTQKPALASTADQSEEDDDDEEDANHEGRFLELTVYELSSSTASSHSASISGTPPMRPADGHQNDSKSEIPN